MIKNNQTQRPLFKHVGTFEGVSIYETKLIKTHHELCLPNIGIFVSEGAFSAGRELPVLKHEFGHVLQYQKLGLVKFYLKIGVSSLFSAIRSRFFKHYHHQNHCVEVEANRLAFDYCNKPPDWDFKNFPVEI
ncbi:hypothetical protein BCY91_13200 [Pelobium manganitolerans]|uniref:DUF4157 domain-containing protein n=1 Tax=Pelobium manganitolerans TaxID=1842495 RepID=A0A419SB71_9SPHI|nr:hypothetical protein [Pelobium manganitolerans]RKD19552.1 hypothetical protein BCY91_13200 [Pelobium manganitolerans]